MSAKSLLLFCELQPERPGSLRVVVRIADRGGVAVTVERRLPGPGPACWEVAARYDVVDVLDRGADTAAAPPCPQPLLLWCPSCGTWHIDRPPHDARPHRTHACQVEG